MVCVFLVLIQFYSISLYFYFFLHLSVFLKARCICFFFFFIMLLVLYFCLFFWPQIFLCLFFFFSGYIINFPVSDSHTQNSIQYKCHKNGNARAHTHKHTSTHTNTNPRCVTPVSFCIQKPDIYVCVNLANCCPSVFRLSICFLSFFPPHHLYLSLQLGFAWFWCHYFLISLSDRQPHCLFSDQGMSNRGIKYNLWRHAVQTTLSSLYFVRCVSVYLLCFHMDFNLWFCFIHWLEEQGQRNP